MSGQSTPSGANTGAASPSASKGSTSSASSSQGGSSQGTINLGMGPSSSTSSQSSRSNQGQSNRMPIDDVFKEYGEEIFRHDRFKELTDVKQKYTSVEPFVNEFGGVEELGRFNQYMGPIWKALGTMDQAKANTTWQKLYPVFQAILNGQEIDPFFAMQQAADQAGAQLDDEDPIKKEIDSVKNEFNKFKQETQNEKLARQKQEMTAIAHKNYTRYEELFSQACSENKIPESSVPFLGDIMVNRLSRYMPINPKTGKPTEALVSVNEAAFKECFNKEVLAAFKSMTQAGVDNAITRTREGGAGIPPVHGQGSTPSGSSVPDGQRAKAARMAQFFTRR